MPERKNGVQRRPAGDFAIPQRGLTFEETKRVVIEELEAIETTEQMKFGPENQVRTAPREPRTQVMLVTRAKENPRCQNGTPLKIGSQATHAQRRMRNVADAKTGVTCLAQKSTYLLSASKRNTGKERKERGETAESRHLPSGKTPIPLTQKLNLGTAEPRMLEGRLRAVVHRCT